MHLLNLLNMLFHGVAKSDKFNCVRRSNSVCFNSAGVGLVGYLDRSQLHCGVIMAPAAAAAPSCALRYPVMGQMILNKAAAWFDSTIHSIGC